MKPSLRHFRISLLTLLACPACFALGWFARGEQFKWDVETAAEKIVQESDGHLDPETGTIFGRLKTAERYSEVSSESQEIKDLREHFLKQMIDKGKLEQSDSGMLVLPPDN